MKKLKIEKMWILRAYERAQLDPEDRLAIEQQLENLQGVHSVHASLEEYSKPFWLAMLDEAKLPPNTRTSIALYVFGMRDHDDQQLDEIYAATVQSPIEFGTVFQMADGCHPNAEFRLNGRWYPVNLRVEFVDDGSRITSGVRLRSTLLLGEQSFDVSEQITKSAFRDKAGNEYAPTVLSVLESHGFRALQTSAVDHNLRLVKAERLAAEHGTLVNITGSVVATSRVFWWRGFETSEFGSQESPRRCVVEPFMESTSDSYVANRGGSSDLDSRTRLPFVRVFCLESKRYVYSDIDDVLLYEFDEDSLVRLHLPQNMHTILQQVFRTPVEKMFGDVLSGKHGGVVVLASGETGVGKTLTAEIYAEVTRRPLYVLELGELGTSASQVEENLRVVFTRVTRWNAVLQFDECEIFLAKRGDDLERSAIVGIFLRLLDYYRGLLFLTTNRAEVLDEAVLSRVMLRLEYPHLNAETRYAIWKTMFQTAMLTTEPELLRTVSGIDLNGRQIRNLTRLAKILFPGGEISRDGLNDVLLFGAGKRIPAESA